MDRIDSGAPWIRSTLNRLLASPPASTEAKLGLNGKRPGVKFYRGKHLLSAWALDDHIRVGWNIYDERLKAALEQSFPAVEARWPPSRKWLTVWIRRQGDGRAIEWMLSQGAPA